MRNAMQILAVALMLVMGSFAFALDDGEREQLRGLRDWYPMQSCKADRELGQCFKWSARDCEKKAEKALDSCLKKLERQYRGSAKGDVDHWQQKILLCTFQDLKAQNSKIAVKSSICDVAGGDL